VRDRDVVDVDLVALDQVQQQVERPLEARQLERDAGRDGCTSGPPSRSRAAGLSTDGGVGSQLGRLAAPLGRGIRRRAVRLRAFGAPGLDVCRAFVAHRGSTMDLTPIALRTESMVSRATARARRVPSLEHVAHRVRVVLPLEPALADRAPAPRS
jgi:hypothetical protein